MKFLKDTSSRVWNSLWLPKVTTIAMLFSFIWLVTFLYWFFNPYKPFEITKTPEALTPEVRAGEEFLYKFSFCKHTNRSAVVKKHIENGVETGLTAFKSSVSKGCKEEVIVSTHVPPFLPPDDYSLTTTFTYIMNPVAEIREPVTFTYSVPFTIIE